MVRSCVFGEVGKGAEIGRRYDWCDCRSRCDGAEETLAETGSVGFRTGKARRVWMREVSMSCSDRTRSSNGGAGRKWDDVGGAHIVHGC